MWAWSQWASPKIVWCITVSPAYKKASSIKPIITCLCWQKKKIYAQPDCLYVNISTENISRRDFSLICCVPWSSQVMQRFSLHPKTWTKSFLYYKKLKARYLEKKREISWSSWYTQALNCGQKKEKNLRYIKLSNQKVEKLHWNPCHSAEDKTKQGRWALSFMWLEDGDASFKQQSQQDLLWSCESCPASGPSCSGDT